MSETSHSKASGPAPGPDAPQRAPGSNSAPASEPTRTDEQLTQTLAHLSAIGDLATAWADNLQAVARLELRRSVSALRQLIFLQLLMIPLVLCLVLSVCLAFAGVVFTETGSLYGGIGAFLGAQLAIIWLALKSQRSLRQLIGFKHTTQQLREAKDDLLTTLK